MAENNEEVEFVLPIGAMGNIAAGTLAQKCGLPISGFVGQFFIYLWCYLSVRLFSTNNNPSIPQRLAPRRFYRYCYRQLKNGFTITVIFRLYK